MRKKSHLSLSRGVIKGLGEENIIKHRYTFYIGSIVPDCLPSFMVRRHTMEETFDVFLKHMEKFAVKLSKKPKVGYVQSIRMGMILHYIADYFTLPHNSHYEGGFKDHCVYEGQQLKCMRGYVEGFRNDKLKLDTPKTLQDIKQIAEYVKKRHGEYVRLHQSVKDDCRFSLETCICVAKSLLGMRENGMGLATS